MPNFTCNCDHMQPMVSNGNARLVVAGVGEGLLFSALYIVTFYSGADALVYSITYLVGIGLLVWAIWPSTSFQRSRSSSLSRSIGKFVLEYLVLVPFIALLTLFLVLGPIATAAVDSYHAGYQFTHVYVLGMTGWISFLGLVAGGLTYVARTVFRRLKKVDRWTPMPPCSADDARNVWKSVYSRLDR